MEVAKLAITRAGSYLEKFQTYVSVAPRRRTPAPARARARSPRARTRRRARSAAHRRPSSLSSLSRSRAQSVAVPAPLAVLSFQLFTFCVALNNAYFLRKALRFEAHWVRALTTLAVLTLGGASLAALLKGDKIPALTGSDEGNGQLAAVALAYLCVARPLAARSRAAPRTSAPLAADAPVLSSPRSRSRARSITFCVPSGSLIVGTPQVRPVWQAVQALNVAFSVRFAMEHAPAGASGLLVVLLAVVQATGGAMIAEYTNMLLL